MRRLPRRGFQRWPDAVLAGLWDEMNFVLQPGEYTKSPRPALSEAEGPARALSPNLRRLPTESIMIAW
ncbi:MAG: hypothetical protein QMD04_03305 [Anaerolineales bacterium]|nr:hypothetical protein [Anaerolineales bacterium]